MGDPAQTLPFDETVTVHGELVSGVMSHCQQGAVFRVIAVLSPKPR